jgi:hypothetical protein
MKIVRLTLFIGALMLPLFKAHAAQSFTFTNITDKSLALFEGARPVFVYNHGIIQKPGVPADRARSTYIHPLYGPDGEILTDDFPVDHYHHRGLFWAWPHVRIGDQHYDLWMLKGIEQKFEGWLALQATATNATLRINNGWFVGDRKVMREEVSIRVSPSSANQQALDLDFTWIPVRDPITLEGAEGKSYGGLTIRYAPRVKTVITTPLGQGEKDLSMTRLPWADLSAQFAARNESSGAAIFVAPDHPDFPPEWLTRHYGALCLGWPGAKPRTFQPGEKIHCRYRILIHRGALSVDELANAYRNYEKHGSAEPADK